MPVILFDWRGQIMSHIGLKAQIMCRVFSSAVV